MYDLGSKIPHKLQKIPTIYNANLYAEHDFQGVTSHHINIETFLNETCF